MKTISTTIYQGEGIESTSTESWSPVYIFEENGKLFVRTDNFGAPDLVTDEGAQHYFILNYDDHPNYISPCRVPAGEAELNEIEPVESDGVTRVVLMNGKIWTIRNGVYLVSLPIQVKSGSETVLNLCDFEPIDITLTTITGEYLETAKVAYEYGPIVKNGDNITWEVTLPLNFSQADAVRVIHKNTLYKK